LNYRKLEYYISKPRLNRYFVAVGNSKLKAQKLYVINLRVAQAFYPVFNLFEIFLRNIVNYQLSSFFSNTDWILTEKNGFMNDPSLKTSQYFLRKSVLKAENSLRQRGSAITSGRIIAEQSLSFWTSLFEANHYRLIRGEVIRCFSSKPKRVNRKVLSQKLNRIREFRNRIYHNEPVCFKGNSIDFKKAVIIKKEMYELLEWIDADLIEYVNHINEIEDSINMKNQL